MDNRGSPLRLLAKTYASSVISREQYVEIRAQLLKRLENRGTIDEADLKSLSQVTRDTEQPRTRHSYTFSDWLIVGLGLAASAVLAMVLYG